jgi:SAM-dependent methyltransferase
MFMADDRQAHWLNPQTALNYARAAVQVGLWASERILINQTFPNKSANILELGCGAGRVGLGLAKEGYSNLTVTDFSPVMVDIAQGVFAEVGMAQSVTIEIANACRLKYPDQSWDGVLFAFNGLMCLRFTGCLNRVESFFSPPMTVRKASMLTYGKMKLFYRDVRMATGGMKPIPRPCLCTVAQRVRPVRNFLTQDLKSSKVHFVQKWLRKIQQLKTSQGKPAFISQSVRDYSLRRPMKNWITYQSKVTKAENKIKAAMT